MCQATAHFFVETPLPASMSRPSSRHRTPPKKNSSESRKTVSCVKKSSTFPAPGTYYYLKYLANESQLVVSGGDTLSFQKSMPMLSPHTYGVPLPKSNQVLRLQSGCAEAHPTAARSTHVVSTVTFLVDFHAVSPHREPRFQPKIA